MEVKLSRSESNINHHILSLGGASVTVSFDTMKNDGTDNLRCATLQRNGNHICTLWDNVAAQALEYWEQNK